MSMIEAVEKSIESALASQRIDESKHAAAIEAIRQLAVKADAASPNDNVTFPTLLKYLNALGMLPEQITEVVTKGQKRTTTETMRSKFKNYGGKL